MAGYTSILGFWYGGLSGPVVDAGTVGRNATGTLARRDKPSGPLARRGKPSGPLELVEA